ncbi:hypothetical protein HYPDE_34888 [Hyphomicrobium denitrificans 1NES1]|uniref:Uncharacterized protein n=1 Tax=Hyphomicrobium denitrificans 1NES1 TaxID=670307 RepID=N0B553_9HYPH|nr:hypothetical protein HYPDE_34888 [Hyphomicrobium denitrificans 1NES1]
MGLVALTEATNAACSTPTGAAGDTIYSHNVFDVDRARTEAKLKAANDNIGSLQHGVKLLQEEVRELKQAWR